MFNDDVRDLMRTYDQQDMLASALKTALIVAVPFGGVIGEFVTHFVPRQRVSRLMEFIEEMNKRLAGLEEQVNERLSSSPAYSALAEEATVMAVRSSSTRRRRDLVELLKTGLARPDAELLEHEVVAPLGN